MGRNRKRQVNRIKRKYAGNKNGPRPIVIETKATQQGEKSMNTRVILGSSQNSDLQYLDADSSRKNGAASFVAWQYRINDVYDPDPLLFTGGVTGFSEMGAFFTRFRVDAVEIHAQISNFENFPVTVGFVFSPESLLASLGTPAAALNALERWGAETPIIMGGVSGNNIAKFPPVRVKPSRILGNAAAYYGNENYCGFFNSTPFLAIYVTFIVYGPSALSLGVFANVRLRFKTHFYNIRSTLLGDPEKLLLTQEYQRTYLDTTLTEEQKNEIYERILQMYEAPPGQLELMIKNPDYQHEIKTEKALSNNVSPGTEKVSGRLLGQNDPVSLAPLRNVIPRVLPSIALDRMVRH